MKFKLLFVFISLGLLSGCASIVSKSDYPMVINSIPDNAQFSVTNRRGEHVSSGTTPASVTLKASSGYFKNETYTFVLTRDGYPEKTFVLTSSVDGWYFGNILFGGLIGMLFIDPATGAMYSLPKRVDIRLDGPAVAGKRHDLTIASTDTLSKAERTRLVRLDPQEVSEY